jgi:hypothetical protein
MLNYPAKPFSAQDVSATLSTDCYAGVLYFEPQPNAVGSFRLGSQAQRHASPFGELDRVGEQINQNLA